MNTIGLAGNPNSGKTTLFNRLTGLRQRTGNYPGITTAMHTAEVKMLGSRLTLLDLPGAYSLYPYTSDEFQFVKLVLDDTDGQRLDLILYVADATALDKQLLLLTQLVDLGYPCVLVLTMIDHIDPSKRDELKDILERNLGIPIFLYDVKDHDALTNLQTWLIPNIAETVQRELPFYKLSREELQLTKSDSGASTNLYKALVEWHHSDLLHPELISQSEERDSRRKQSVHLQIKETLNRYEQLAPIEADINALLVGEDTLRSDKLDKVLTHSVWGVLIFVILLFTIFQAIYAWSEWPMDMVDRGIASIGQWLEGWLPSGLVTSFIVDGLLAGIGGILVFVPQIAILFVLLGLLEHSGYMARVVYMFDHLMRRFGMSGRSIVAMMSAGACAIPAIMSARSIENKRERLITILTAPLISCSARIPVYTILIGMAVPAVTIGWLNLRGIVFAGLYLGGIIAALVAGLLFKLFIKSDVSGQMVIELPNYQLPNITDVLLDVWQRTKAFVIGAGRIIIVISMILWLLGTFGPGTKIAEAEARVQNEAIAQGWDDEHAEQMLAEARLANSYAGHIGQWIEPAIRPLGYDWKIGIALLASIAAREVFVGTIATLYSLDGVEDEGLLRERLAKVTFDDTGEQVFSLATAVSLLVFFLFAMQCMSTLAIVKQETGTWKWPIMQLIAFSIIAYLGAWCAYQILS